jgi:hypothetical protein
LGGSATVGRHLHQSSFLPPLGRGAAAPRCNTRAGAGNCAADAPLPPPRHRATAPHYRGRSRRQGQAAPRLASAPPRRPCFRTATTALPVLPPLPPPPQQRPTGHSAALGLRSEAPLSAAVGTQIKLPAAPGPLHCSARVQRPGPAGAGSFAADSLLPPRASALPPPRSRGRNRRQSRAASPGEPPRPAPPRSSRAAPRGASGATTASSVSAAACACSSTTSCSVTAQYHLRQRHQRCPQSPRDPRHRCRRRRSR